MIPVADESAVRILLVEDDPADAELTIRALRRSKVANEPVVVETGQDALAYLRTEPPFEDAEQPDLILLDLKLPGMSGLELLDILKDDPELHRIPVVVLTTSENPEDITKAYDLRANCYLTKPVDLRQFMRVIGSIDTFWLSIVTLQPRVA
jgi:CheY-like chemotaxis protein